MAESIRDGERRAGVTLAAVQWSLGHEDPDDL